MTGRGQRYGLRTAALVFAVACGHAKPNPTLVGTDGADTLEGTARSETLSGGDGDDLLSGGEGEDVLEPGAGEDRVIGGPGADTFVLNLQLPAQVRAQILDFTPGEGDRIVIKGAHSSDIDQLMKRLSILDGVLILQPDAPGRSANALVQIGNKWRIEMLTEKKHHFLI